MQIKIPFKSTKVLVITFSISLILSIISGILIYLSYNEIICSDAIICLGAIITFIIFTVSFSVTSLGLLIGLIISLRVNSKRRKEETS